MTAIAVTINRGFTLVELMIAMTVTVVLAGGLILTHLSGRAAFTDVAQISRIQENVRFASDYMIRDIRIAGFRDETFLRFGHELQIGTGYAILLDGDGNGIEDTLRIRYAGRGHCTQAFDEFRLVENEYSLNNLTGELSCRGRTVARDDPGDTQITDQAFSDPVGLVRGITAIAFQRVCPDGGTACACDLVNDLDNSCIGVRVALQLEGLRALDGSGILDDRSIELTAAFRNVILQRVNTFVFESEE